VNTANVRYHKLEEKQNINHRKSMVKTWLMWDSESSTIKFLFHIGLPFPGSLSPSETNCFPDIFYTHRTVVQDKKLHFYCQCSRFKNRCNIVVAFNEENSNFYYHFHAIPLICYDGSSLLVVIAYGTKKIHSSISRNGPNVPNAQ